jgi:FKBP-type peptidyl-prolyl cis-trans isomerase
MMRKFLFRKLRIGSLRRRNYDDFTHMNRSLAVLLSTLAFGLPVVAQTTPTTPAKPKTGTAATTHKKPPAGATAKKATTGAKTGAAVTSLKDQREKASYGIGWNLGSSLRQQSVDVDPDIINRGLHDGMSGTKPLISEEEAHAAVTQLQKDVREQQEKKRLASGDKNKTAGEAFLAANKAKPGVVTLPSGLQYKILKEGTGPKPTATDSVTVNYRGTLLDGTEFDSSYKRGQPATFPVNRVIKGWTEALQLMPVGSKWELYIPSDLAYGAGGAGGDIGPNATLIFEVELLSIGDKAQ